MIYRWAFLILVFSGNLRPRSHWHLINTFGNTSVLIIFDFLSSLKCFLVVVVVVFFLLFFFNAAKHRSLHVTSTIPRFSKIQNFLHEVLSFHRRVKKKKKGHVHIMKTNDDGRNYVNFMGQLPSEHARSATECFCIWLWTGTGPTLKRCPKLHSVLGIFSRISSFALRNESMTLDWI